MTKELEKIKVFFIDLDGTLIDEKNEKISPINLKAIHDLQKRAHVIISTGRMGENLKKYLKVTKVEYAVAANGAQIIDSKNNILSSKTLDAKSTKLILDFAIKKKLSFKMNDEKNAFGVKGILSKFICKILKYKTLKHRNYQAKKIYKLVLWGKNRKKIKKITRELKTFLPNVSIVNSTKGFTIEITNVKATKGLGNEFIWKKILKIEDINLTAHIGDSMNDSTVIGFVGMFIAMKNSPKDLIKLANYLGPNYKNGGLSKLINDNYIKKLKNN